MADCLIHHVDARGVHTLTLNEPARHNVLSVQMLDALEAAIRAVSQDDGARVLVIAAAGKAFCAGHDLKQMMAPEQNEKLAYYQHLFAHCSRMMLSLQNLRLPVVAQVQGLATAAGCQLVAQCDLAVASSMARFGVSGINLGLFCATPSVPLVRSIPLKRAMDMLMTGEFVTAEVALGMGLVNRVAAPEALCEATESLLASLLSKPKEALAMGKALVYQHREMGAAAAYQLASQTMATNMMLPCAQQGVAGFLRP